MGHHIDEQGRFQSDKHPTLKPDKVVIDLTDPAAWAGLMVIAQSYMGKDREFARDLAYRINVIRDERCSGGEHPWDPTTRLCSQCGISQTTVEELRGETAAANSDDLKIGQRVLHRSQDLFGKLIDIEPDVGVDKGFVQYEWPVDPKAYPVWVPLDQLEPADGLRRDGTRD